MGRECGAQRAAFGNTREANQAVLQGLGLAPKAKA
jgi:hypothetical protein